MDSPATAAAGAPILAPGTLDEHGDSPSPPPDLALLGPEQRVSFYVQAVDDMIDAVLEHEGFLFDPVELGALNRFRSLPYQSRYLFSRLLLRKHAWIRRSSLLNSASYTRDISDLATACEGLCQAVGPVMVEAGPSGLSDDDKEEIKKRSASPPVPAPCPPVKDKDDSTVIDLTLSDSDEGEEKKPLKRSRNGKPIVSTPKKPKLEAKPPEPPPVRPTPRKLVSDDGSPPPDLSHFAHDTQHLLLEPPEAILALLSSEELTSLGKKMKVAVRSGASRAEWIKGLLRTSNQSTLSFFVAKPPPPPSPESAGMERKLSTGTVGVGYDSKGNKLTQSSVVSNHALKLIGDVVRLSPSALKLFGRLSLVYHRTAYSSPSGGLSASSPLTMSLLARFGKRRYPKYIVSRSWALFGSRQTLREFEAAMQIEKALEECLDGLYGPGAPKRFEKETRQEKMTRYKRGTEIWESIEGEWRRLCDEAEREMKIKEEQDEAEERRLYYRRRFHPGWPLSRAAYKAAACYAKLGNHDAEVSILRHLLSQSSFRRGKRGDWYDRLALVLMRYPLGDEARLLSKWGCKTEPAEDGSSPKVEVELQGSKKEKKDAMLRARREEALALCEKALTDPYTHLIYKSSLQRRIARIESALDVPAEDRRAFNVLLAKATPRTMEGERIDTPTIGRKSVWRASDGEEVSVEGLCLEHFHSENGVLTMIFALIFWDILFAPVDGVFETPFQTAPLDLATDAFSVVRRPAINDRLAAVAAGEGLALLKETDDRERPLETFAVGIRWARYTQEDLLEIVQCMGPQALAAILTVFVEEYGHRTGGIPDLCLWNPETSRALFSEIKGPGDQLSETQKVWIDVLLAAGVGVEVVKVVETKERREETPDSAIDNDEDEGVKDEGEDGPKKKKQRRKRAAKSTRARSEIVKKENGTRANSSTPAPKKRAARPAKKMKKVASPKGEETGSKGEVQEMVLDDSD
ncbi:hypothetical protein JCM10908_004258 [Rhodotorula pacifica]|uniref:fanconi-associated nuclease 1 n=1 Tax=Rhodotorula pacifica TaxID=1495444 RepID=UPI00317077BB